MTNAHLAADIGGTFTDIAVEHQGALFTCKVPTVPEAPEEGIFQGVRQAMEETGLSPSDFSLIVHGTTLATNALIERKGAKTAMLVTDGFRDAVEMASEKRSEQYDIVLAKPPPPVPREFRFVATEPAAGKCNVLWSRCETPPRRIADMPIDSTIASRGHGPSRP